MKRSFVKEYFDGKSLAQLKTTITPHWENETLEKHLKLVDVPVGTNSVLEIGSGLSRLLNEIHKSVEYCVGVEASQRMVDEAKLISHPDIEIIKVSGNGNIPIPLKDYFDFIFSIITFQHIPDTDVVKKYISEAFRLLHKDGLFRFQCLSSDINPGKELWTYHNIEDLIEYMKSFGFNSIKRENKGRWEIISGTK